MTNPSKTTIKDFKYVGDNLHINSVSIKDTPVSMLLSYWKTLISTSGQKVKVSRRGTSILEELASRIAEEQACLKKLGGRNLDLDSVIAEQRNELMAQEKVVGVLRDHCRKSSLRQVIQDAKIKSLEKDKECLHGLIDYQKAELNEQGKN